MGVTDNMDEYLDGLDDELPNRRVHTLEFLNALEYAEYLHHRLGYFVFGDSHMAKTLTDHLTRLVRSPLPLTDRNVERTLDAVGFDEINFLRSYTEKMRPPVKKGEGPRRAHPGGWADVTGNLKAAYTHMVNGGRPRAEHQYR